MRLYQYLASRHLAGGSAPVKILIGGLAGICLLRLYPGVSVALGIAQAAYAALARSWDWSSQEAPLVFAAAGLELASADAGLGSTARLAEANLRTWSWDVDEVKRLSAVARMATQAQTSMSPGAPAVMLGANTTTNLNIYLGLACLMTPASFTHVPPLAGDSMPAGQSWKRLTLIFGEPGVSADVQAKLSETHTLRLEDGPLSLWTPIP